jgi:hypothetical protein
MGTRDEAAKENCSRRCAADLAQLHAADGCLHIQHAVVAAEIGKIM